MGNIIIWAPIIALLSIPFYLIIKGKKVNFLKFSCVLVYVLLLCFLVRQAFLNESKKYQKDLQRKEMVTIDSIKNLPIKQGKTYPLKIYRSSDYLEYNLRNELYWGILVDDTIKVGTLDELKPFMEKPLSEKH